MLLMDTLQENEIKQTLAQFSSLSDSLGIIVGDVSGISSSIRSGNGILGILVSDSLAADQLRLSLYHVEKGTENINRLSEALKHNFLFKKGLKKMEKQKESDTLPTPKR